jgi:hypothetical protein
LVVKAYTVKSGLFIIVLLQSDWKLVGLFIIVLFQSDWKLVGLPSIFVYCRCVNPVALPYRHWFESIVNASVLFVNILILLIDPLYIPLDPLKVISGVFLVLYEYESVGV